MIAHLSRLVLCVLLVLPQQARADPVHQVITEQIEAFLADDYETAFSLASPAIQNLFGSPERFGQMVRNGYPMVHRPQDVTMLEQRLIDGRIIQRVMIRDTQGRLHMLAYQMIDTDQGWQINGVQLLRASEVGT